ncbi:MAG: BamA/TamA family outer membrane protein [Bacteroidaceae bacterium]|nr:BamA/TamA family outer membrane protein [Bacteroidaceae bacterium]
MKNKFLFSIVLTLLLTACSTTSKLPEGETLYTGIGTVSYVDQGGKDKDASARREGGVIVAIADAAHHVRDAFTGKKSGNLLSQKQDQQPDSVEATKVNDEDALESVEEEIESVIAYPPNNSFFGSSRLRTPLPIGLWAYNAWGESEKGLGHWLFKIVGSQPVLISSVSPDTRAKVAENVLRNHGFFRSHVDYTVTPHRHNSRKAKVNYYVHTGRAWRIDSVEYLGFPDYADSIIQATRKQSYLHKDTPFSAATLQNEQTRIANLLRNRGYYYYKPSFATYKADTILRPYRVQLRMQCLPTLPPLVKRQWYIGKMNLTVLSSSGDTVRHTIPIPEGTYTYSGSKPPIRPEAVMRNVLHRRGGLYRYMGQEKTQELLNELGIFSHISLSYTPRDTSRMAAQIDIGKDKDTLDLNINAILDLRYNADFEVNVTERNGSRIGPGLSLSLKKKNAFRGAELLSFKIYGSYEWTTTNLDDYHTKGLFNSYEVGTKLSLDLPRMLVPGMNPQRLRFPASTTIAIYADLLNRAGYFNMLSFGTSLSYSWRRNRTSRHEFTPLSLTYTKLNRTTYQFDSILSESPALMVSMEDKFIPAMQYTYGYTSSRNHRNPLTWQLSIKQAGALTAAAYAIGGRNFSEKDKKLFNNPFAQYIKVTSELHNNWRLNTNTRLVTRIMGGIAWAYGNSDYVPYSDQFYCGGANSIRAFPIRRIGPGRFVSSHDKWSYLDQTGDVKLEGNVELRFPLFGSIYGATFLDAGNIWLLRDYDYFKGATFRMRHLLTDLALGTGVGVRYDLDFLVLRLDLGVALHDPGSTRTGYFNTGRFADRFALHLAIGYPF